MILDSLCLAPFSLDNSARDWVQRPLASLTDDEKIGQLFVFASMGFDRAEAGRLATVKPAGIAGFFSPMDDLPIRQSQGTDPAIAHGGRDRHLQTTINPLTLTEWKISGNFHAAMARHWHLVQTAMISFVYPYSLHDAPQMPTYVNGFSTTDSMQAAVPDYRVGRAVWNPTSPVDAFCGLECARY